MGTLILFDVNGTLIMRDSRTDIPYSQAVDLLLGTDNAMKGVDTSARSDRDVLMEVLRREGVDYTESLWSRFMDIYVSKLEEFRTTDVWRANADAVPFVRKLSKAGYTMVLITGELSVGAEFKLTKIGIWDRFLTGGYGEDGLRRFDIADSAIRKVQALTGRQFESMFVMGDTVLDIETARHLGAESVAITTGSHSRKELLEAGPDHCIDRFGEVENLFL